MSKDPAFLFYPNDYIGGTMGMTFEEKGAYMELLMLQFNRGHMTYHMIGQTVGQLWENIKCKFVKDETGLYYNERLEEEQKKRKAYVYSRNKNKNGINQWSKTKNKSGHMTSHMENENKDKDINNNNSILKGECEGEEKKTAKKVIDYFNEHFGSRYTCKGEGFKHILARIKEGANYDDCIEVVSKKEKDIYFINNPKYLNPTTLFRPGNFEKYLNEMDKPDREIKKTDISFKEAMEDFLDEDQKRISR